jgi:hypothetical protein
LNAYYFLTHALLMKDVSAWASRTNTPFVDVIQATDRDRDVLLTAVHLGPRGNRMLAAAFDPAPPDEDGARYAFAAPFDR